MRRTKKKNLESLATLATRVRAHRHGGEKIRNEWAGIFLPLFLPHAAKSWATDRLQNREPSHRRPRCFVLCTAPAQNTITRALLTDGEPNGGHPNPAPDRPPQIQLPLHLHGIEKAIRGGEGDGVGGDGGDGEAGRQGGAQPARDPPLRARRPPVAQVGVRAEQVPVDVLGQGDVLPAAGEGEGVPGGGGGVRGDRGGGPGGVPQGDELHLGRRRGRRQALQVRVGYHHSRCTMLVSAAAATTSILVDRDVPVD